MIVVSNAIICPRATDYMNFSHLFILTSDDPSKMGIKSKKKNSENTLRTHRLQTLHCIITGVNSSQNFQLKYMMCTRGFVDWTFFTVTDFFWFKNFIWRGIWRDIGRALKDEDQNNFTNCWIPNFLVLFLDLLWQFLYNCSRSGVRQNWEWWG